jgi:hypothetical protein
VININIEAPVLFISVGLLLLLSHLLRLPGAAERAPQIEPAEPPQDPHL